MLLRHAVRPLCAGGILLGLTLSPSVRADQNDWEAMRQQQRRNYEGMVGNMPLIDSRSIRDMVQIRMENKGLVLRTILPSTRSEGYMRVKLQGTDLAGLVRIQGGADPIDRKPISPSVFQFNLTDFSRPAQIATLAVNAQPTFFSITRSIQLPSGYRNVQIMQQKSPAYSGLPAGWAQLIVNEADRDGTPPLSVSLDAPDFFTLLRRNPKEVDAYVRPLLRDLGQESVFAPDPLIAWQVFSDLWKPDADARKQVMGLLAGLDAEDYRERERAQSDIQKLGREGAAVLTHLDRAALTPEQNARIDRALAPYAQLPSREAVRLRSDPAFLLDCLYSDDLKLRAAALERLREVVGAEIRLETESTPDGRAAKIAELRRKLVGSSSSDSGKK